jgi:hypothetical protein
MHAYTNNRFRSIRSIHISRNESLYYYDIVYMIVMLIYMYLFIIDIAVHTYKSLFK